VRGIDTQTRQLAQEFRTSIAKQDTVLDVLERGHGDLRDSLTSIKTVLVGMNGDNGLNGTVKSIDARVHALEIASVDPPKYRKRRKAP
jgi:hypothetical protein